MAQQTVTNLGRLIDFVTGITGVSAGGQAVVNLPVNRRFHRLLLQCACVNYTGGTALAVVNITGTGSGATITPTIVNGVVTAVTVVAGGTGYAVGNTFTFVDATGTGFIGTVATLSTSALATATVTVGGTASPVNPVTLLTSVRLLVNGINMRDISPLSILMIAQNQGLNVPLGSLPIYFTAPWRNVNNFNEVSSWDLAGQSTFQLQFSISSTVSLPSVTAVEEFDFMRNVQGAQSTPFLQPVSQHQFSMPIIAGRNDIITLPINFPVSRLFLIGSTPGTITQLEIYQDQNKVLEGMTPQIIQSYQDYGFQFGTPNYVNQNIGSTNALKAAYNPVTYFDVAYISDPDERYWKALKCLNQMIVRVYSSTAQTLTIVQETLPGAYAA